MPQKNNEFVWSEKDKRRAAALIFAAANAYEVKPLRARISAVVFLPNGTTRLSAKAHNHTLEYAVFDGENWKIMH